MTSWTIEQTETLKQLWAVKGPDGKPKFSARQIARQIGDGMTRNSILGKKDRLGLEERQNGATKGSSRRKNGSRPKTQRTSPFVFPDFESAPYQEPSDFEVKTQPCSLLELTNETCRFPYGDPGTPDFYFCGISKANNSGGRPYCPAHSRIVYRGLTSRQRGVERLAEAV